MQSPIFIVCEADQPVNPNNAATATYIFRNQAFLEAYFEPWYVGVYSLCLDSDGCRYWLTTDGLRFMAVKAEQSEALKKRFLQILAATVDGYTDRLKNELNAPLGRPVTPDDVRRIIADPDLVGRLTDYGLPPP